MHLLLFHEMPQIDPTSDNNTRRGDGGLEGPHSDAVAAGIATAKQPRAATYPVAQHRGGALSRSNGEREEEDTQGGFDPLGGRSGRARHLLAGVGGSRQTSAAGVGGGGDRDGGGVSSRGASTGSDGRVTAATTGKNGRFATAGRVQEYRTMLKGAAAHASQMKVCVCICVQICCFLPGASAFLLLDVEMVRST